MFWGKLILTACLSGVTPKAGSNVGYLKWKPLLGQAGTLGTVAWDAFIGSKRSLSGEGSTHLFLMAVLVSWYHLAAAWLQI